MNEPILALVIKDLKTGQSYSFEKGGQIAHCSSSESISDATRIAINAGIPEEKRDLVEYIRVYSPREISFDVYFYKEINKHN